MAAHAQSDGRPRGTGRDTAQRILDVAEGLVQVRGFNGFSYADIAGDIGIAKASLHYHYAGKAELGEALIARYAERFLAALAAIEADGRPAPAKLAAYAELYADVLRARRMCLCGMLAAEYDTLPDGMRAAILRFFDANEAWLVRVIEQGRADGTLRADGAVDDAARMIVSGLEGAMLVGRPYGDVERFEQTARALLGTLAAP